VKRNRFWRSLRGGEEKGVLEIIVPKRPDFARSARIALRGAAYRGRRGPSILKEHKHTAWEMPVFLSVINEGSFAQIDTRVRVLFQRKEKGQGT